MPYDRELADRLRAELSGTSGVTEKAMFGGLAFLVGGHMAVAASRSGGILVRCDPADSEALLADPAASRMVMRGREMSGWLRVDPGGIEGDDDLRRWVEVGIGYVASLSPTA